MEALNGKGSILMIRSDFISDFDTVVNLNWPPGSIGSKSLNLSKRRV